MATSIPLAALLDPILATLRPARTATIPIAEALGRVLAEPLIARNPVPARSIALADGYAVAALDLVGASAHSPIMLPTPPLVHAGESLPKETDAVLDASFVSSSAGFAEITDGVAPGTDVRFAGHDLAAGAAIAAAGTLVTPEIQLAAAHAGIKDAAIRSVSVMINFEEPAITAWWGVRLTALGCAIVPTGGDMEVRSATAARPRVALRPGASAWVAREGDLLVVETPSRFDGSFAVLAGIVRPILSFWLDRRPEPVARRLTRKVASGVGQTDLVLVAHEEIEATPLAVGEATLSALARTTGYLLVPPGLEGYALGETVAVVPINS